MLSGVARVLLAIVHNNNIYEIHMYYRTTSSRRVSGIHSSSAMTALSMLPLEINIIHRGHVHSYYIWFSLCLDSTAQWTVPSAMGGPGLEVFKFTLYLFVPIAALVHFGDPDWYRNNVVPVRFYNQLHLLS